MRVTGYAGMEGTCHVLLRSEAGLGVPQGSGPVSQGHVLSVGVAVLLSLGCESRVRWSLWAPVAWDQVCRRDGVGSAREGLPLSRPRAWELVKVT